MCLSIHDIDFKVIPIYSCINEDKIGSKDLATHLIHTLKFEIKFKTKKYSKALQGSLSRTMGNYLLSMELHKLLLQWPLFDLTGTNSN